MTWGAVAAAAATVIGGSMQASAAKDAARTTARATGAASDLQRRIYEENVQRNQPFYEAGINALPQYVQGIQPGGELTRGFTMADYQADPGYAFRLQEGIKALDRTAAARGGLLGGNQLRGVAQFGQNLASEEFGNAYNRFVNQQNVQRNALAGLANIGQTTASTLGAAGQNMASNVGNLVTQQGVNAANAGLVGARATASMYGDVANQLGKINFGNVYNRTFGYPGSQTTPDFIP
jgi:hypothetical protein